MEVGWVSPAVQKVGEFLIENDTMKRFLELKKG